MRSRYKIRQRQLKDGEQFQVVCGSTIMGRFECYWDAKDRKDALDAIDQKNL
jgi:hypothetical protein